MIVSKVLEIYLAGQLFFGHRNSIYSDIASVASVKGSFGSPIFEPPSTAKKALRGKPVRYLPILGDIFQKT
jgi:hypothetical protein